MKEQNIYVRALKREITVYIGEDKEDNFNTIDNADPDDLWFHADKFSSCHIVCKIPKDFDKKNMRYIVSTGAVLCKSNTNNLKSLKNVTIVYTQVKNITKTNIPGSVIATNKKYKIC